MPSELFGKWKLVQSDKFDEYMKEVGVNIALRKMGAVVSSTSEIIDEGDDQIRIDTQSTFKSANVLFPLGKEIEEKTMDGRKCRTTLTWDGKDKLLEIQKWDDGKKQTKLEWMIRDGKMILRLEYNGVVCERVHERCE